MLAALAAAGTAGAEEPRKTTEPSVLAEPGEVTQVVDAFDDYDDFDLNLSLGYQYTTRSAKIRRESHLLQDSFSTGGYVTDSMNVAEYSQATSRLNTRAEVGVYKDIALVLRMPIILSDERKLAGLEGSTGQQSLVLAGAPGEQLFRLPFKSPTRSGVEYFAVGLEFGIFNQYRDSSKPTWVVGFEGRFDVSEPMHACSDTADGLNQLGPQRKCADPSDINRNGVSGEMAEPAIGGRSLEGNFSGGREPGVSRGVTGLEAHTFISKRVKYIEPYGGFRALFEFPTEASDYGRTDLKGSLVNHPPLQGSLIFGMMVIPWEVRDQFQRFTIDFRFTGAYRSEGRDYSELFDALGSSDARSLRMPQFAEFQQNPACETDLNDPSCLEDPSVVNPNSQRVYFTGLTDVQQHGIYTFSTEMTWQAGEYVKFNVGGGYTLVQSHIVAFDQACNPDFDDNRFKAGPCRTSSSTTVGGVSATGIPNPNYRAAINTPGRRFLVDDSGGFDVWINATVMF
ncbi:MAG: hypothetical protein IT376_09180 [Polyangiaceae bacterium]|nr:hypothetical protein [Polyangiaceae bacterium]